MAGYSNNREQNLEMKYLRKVLGEVDADITIPDSVRSAALRRTLDDIKPATYWPDMLHNLLRQKPRAGSLRAVLSYAAAFAVIITVAYLLGISGGGEVSEGVVLPRQEQVQGTEPEPAGRMEVESFSDAATAPGEDTQPPQREQATQPDAPLDPPTGEAVAEPRLGTGGGGIANFLATKDGYTYNWRLNDATDPDKANFPITIDIVKNDSEVEAQIDIADMQSIEAGYLEQDTLVVVGSGEQAVVVRTYVLTDKLLPAEGIVRTQEGAYISSMLHEGAVELATLHSGQTQEEETELPGRTSDLRCILSLTDTATGEAVSRAFVGADGAIDLQAGVCVLRYTVLQEEGDQEASASAQVELGTMKLQ